MAIKSVLRRFLPKRFQPHLHRIYFGVLRLWYKGKKYHCLLCDRQFRRFLSFGVQSRPNARCPGCGSLERHRFLWLYLKEKTNFFTERLKVLDIAPLPIFQEKCKSLPNIEYLSADISSPFAMVRMDITDIKFPSNTFDCIICSHVLEHIPDDQQAMKELYRVLNPGGWAILQSPVDYSREKTFEDPRIVLPDEREKMFGQRDHVRIYGCDYKNRIERVGFNVKVDRYINEIEDSIIEKFCLPKVEFIYFCVKPRR